MANNEVETKATAVDVLYIILKLMEQAGGILPGEVLVPVSIAQLKACFDPLSMATIFADTFNPHCSQIRTYFGSFIDSCHRAGLIKSRSADPDDSSSPEIMVIHLNSKLINDAVAKQAGALVGLMQPPQPKTDQDQPSTEEQLTEKPSEL